MLRLKLLNPPPYEHEQKGVLIKLNRRILTIGSSETVMIKIDYGDLKPEHMLIEMQEDELNLKRMHKKAFIALNGRECTKAMLSEGDVLTAGDLNYIVSSTDAENSTENSIYNSYDRLYQFSAALNNADSTMTLLNELIDMLIDITNAENGFIVLEGDDRNNNILVSRNIDDRAIPWGKEGISDNIISRLIDTKKSILVSDISGSEDFRNAKSIVNLKLSSVMAVPLIYRNNYLGFIYLGSRSIMHMFDDSMLKTLEIFASQAALITYNALQMDDLKQKTKSLTLRIEDMIESGVIGTCDSMVQIFEKLKKIASIDIPVLLLGETGTGKEVIAKSVHHNSKRANKPFIAVNCGAIPEKLLESEFFGYVKGAFTGANTDKTGIFEAAKGGTVFLDEVGDMPLPLQVKLLRVLDEHRITRVGATKSVPVDIRIVAATNADLQDKINSGTFREDLYYRLNVIKFVLPPLRERGDDIKLIARFLLNRYVKEYGLKNKRFSKSALDAMMIHNWPGEY